MSEPVVKTVVVACAPAHAFEVFTARIDAWWPPGHRRFSASRLTLEAGIGGRLFERSQAGEEALLGEVRVWDPPARLVYTWLPGAASAPTQVEIRFTAEGERTRVDVRHSEGEAALGDAWPSRAAIFTRSWDAVLLAFDAAASRAG